MLIFSECELYSSNCFACKTICKTKGFFDSICSATDSLTTNCYCCNKKRITEIIAPNDYMECEFQLGLSDCYECDKKCRKYGFVKGVCQNNLIEWTRCFCCTKEQIEISQRLANKETIKTTSKL